MEIYGGETLGMTAMARPFFLIRPHIMETEKQTLLLPTCLAGFHRLFMMPMKENIQSTEVFANGKPFTTSTMNSIISIYSVVAMETLPSLA